MNRDEFDALVKRLEVDSQRHPRWFVIRTALLVLASYTYLFLLLTISLGVSGLVIALMIYKPGYGTIKLGFFMLILFGGMLWAILRGLWVRIDPPEGLRVTRSETPGLFDMLDDLRRSLKCEPFHETLIVNDHNAAVVQVPRLGIFGWHKNYLLLGLPMLQGLGPEEFKAVLAHEFTHSSKGHGRFGNWLYRLRLSWHRVIEQIERQGSGGFAMLNPFLKYFWPKFDGHAFVLSRANEYEADATAARLTSVKDASNALMRVAVNSRLLSEKFWPDFWQQANVVPTAPANCFWQISNALRKGGAREDTAKWLQQAFNIETNVADTHPSLKDRVRAIGGGETVPLGLAPLGRTAAEVFLGDHLKVITDQLEAQAREPLELAWKYRHEEAVKTASELATLETPAAEAETEESLWKKTLAILDLKGDEAATPCLDRLLAIKPDHEAANFIRGRIYLEQDDSRGIDYIERAIALNPAVTDAGCQALYAYYQRTGQKEKLRPIENRIDEFEAYKAKADQERNNVTAKDSFVAADLTEEQANKLRTLLAKEPDVASASAARKVMQYFAKDPLFVISLRIKTAWWKPRGSDANQKIINRLVEQIDFLPGYCLVFVAEDDLKSLGKKIFGMPNSLVYSRAS